MAKTATSASPVDRLPPHSIEAEQGVLGAILLSPADNIEDCVQKFPGGSTVFYDLRHQMIYGAMLDLYADRKPIDLIVLQQHLKDRNELEQAHR